MMYYCTMEMATFSPPLHPQASYSKHDIYFIMGDSYCQFQRTSHFNFMLCACGRLVCDTLNFCFQVC